MILEIIFCAILFAVLWIVVSPIKYYKYTQEKKRLVKVFYDEYFKDENWFAEKISEIESFSASENFSDDEILVLNAAKDFVKFWLELRKRRQDCIKRFIGYKTFLKSNLWLIDHDINYIKQIDGFLKDRMEVLRILQIKHL